METAADPRSSARGWHNCPGGYFRMTHTLASRPSSARHVSRCPCWRSSRCSSPGLLAARSGGALGRGRSSPQLVVTVSTEDTDRWAGRRRPDDPRRRQHRHHGGPDAQRRHRALQGHGHRAEGASSRPRRRGPLGQLRRRRRSRCRPGARTFRSRCSTPSRHRYLPQGVAQAGPTPPPRPPGRTAELVRHPGVAEVRRQGWTPTDLVRAASGPTDLHQRGHGQGVRIVVLPQGISSARAALASGLCSEATGCGTDEMVQFIAGLPQDDPRHR